MPQNPPLQPRRARPFQTVDDTLREAFAPILSEAVPDRFRVILDALALEGSVDDCDDNRPR